MSTTQLLAEYLIVGFLTLFGITDVLGVSIGGLTPLTGLSDLVVALILLAISYVLGFIVNVLAEAVFQPLYRKIELDWKLREGNPALVLDQLRYDLYAKGPAEVIHRIDYHRSLLRIARSVALVSLLLTIGALIRQQLIGAGSLLVIFLVALLAYQRRVMWFTKTVYFSWLALDRKAMSELSQRGSVALPATQLENNIMNDAHVVVFAGGTGFREINIELVKHTHQISRIVPIWDNGGSSKILRKYFSVIPVGDVRHALMTMAHGEGQVGEVVKLFNWRLPDTGSDKDLRDEFHRFATGVHPLVNHINPSLKDVIVKYLQIFEAALPEAMDLRRGSIGNFVLMGAYLSHAQDMNTAIYVFRQLCSIRGEVWPVSLEANVHIGAHLENGRTVVGQELVTNLDRSKYREKIEGIFFTQDLSQNQRSNGQLRIKANSLILEALQSASIVVFGPGSYFTSVLPHRMVEGVPDTLASLDVPKVLIGNILECNETYDYTLKECVEAFLATAHKYASSKRVSRKYLTHIIANDSGDLEFMPGTSIRYLPLGKDCANFERDGISFISQDFEDPWQRGHHNPKQITELLMVLSAGGASLAATTQKPASKGPIVARST